MGPLGCHVAMVGQQILQWVEELLVALEVEAPSGFCLLAALALGKVVAGGTHLGSGSWGLELAPGWLELLL